MKYPAYPQYKDSGVAWLGEVPEHWEIKRLDFLASVKARLGWKALTASEYVDEGYVFLATPNIKGEKNIDYDKVNYITRERYIESPEIMLKEGDVLLAKDGSTLGITNVVRNLPRPATVNSSIAVIRPKAKNSIDSNFLFRWLTGSFMQSTIESLKDGQGVPHLFQADIRKFTVIAPSLYEQTAIADFLDQETGRIDTLVAKKRKLVELLKEKRSALISRTVTRGLPDAAAREFGLEPHINFMDSRIDWLGNIPREWEIRPIKAIVSTPVTDGPHETPEILDEGIPFVSAEAINGGKINFERLRGYISEDDHKRYSRKYKPQFGDIYMVKSGATTGRVAMVETNEEFNIWSPLAAIRCNPNKVERKFLFFYLQSKEFQKAVELSWSFGTQQNIGMGVIQNLFVPLGSLVEQSALAKYLDRETVKIDRLVKKVETAITRLQEYRSALITAAVTGKIDVRDAVQ